MFTGAARCPTSMLDAVSGRHSMPRAPKGAQSYNMTKNNLQSLKPAGDVRVGSSYFLNSTKEPIAVTLLAVQDPYYLVQVVGTGQQILVKLEHIYTGGDLVLDAV